MYGQYTYSILLDQANNMFNMFDPEQMEKKIN